MGAPEQSPLTALPAPVAPGEVAVPCPEAGSGPGLAKVVEQLTHEIARLSSLYRARSEISHHIAKETTEPLLLAAVCRVCVDLGSMRMAWIGGPNGTTQRMEALASHGAGTAYIDDANISVTADAPQGRGPVGRAYRTGESVIINDLNADASTLPWRKLASRFGFRSVGCFPIERAGSVYAVLAVYSERRNSFDAEAVNLLQQTARDLGYALGAMDRTRERDTALLEVRTSAQALQDKNAFLESILRSEPEGVTVVDTAGRLVQMNEAGLNMFGVRSLEEMRERGLAGYLLPKHRQAFLDLHARVCKGEKGILELQARAGDGTVRWMEIHATPLRNSSDHITALLGIVRDISDRKHSAEVIWKQANFDLLTGLPNRYMFQDRLAQEIKKAQRSGTVLGLLFIDLDFFKEVNETLGHESGDALLVAVAQRITACVRESDTVARLGGDEFTVIMPLLPAATAAEASAHNIITRLGEPFAIGGESIVLSASVGMTFYPSDARTVDGLLKNADQAMHEAKRQGRNRAAYFTTTMQQEAQTRLRTIGDLRGALEAGQFRVYFQAVVDLTTQRICAAEALLRWEHPRRGLVSPAEFIPIAENTGLILGIGDWVFREAAKWAKRWALRHGSQFQVTVNNSPMQFRDPRMLLAWPQYLDELGLAGSNMTIEITEGLLLDADAGTTRVLRRLRESGIGVSIDDFGTGYSSLSYLHKFQLDVLKIDQSFIRNLLTEPGANALSESIIVMGHKLGLKVVAEGVETAEQRDFLIAAGCDYAQGYLFSRPMPAEAFDALLQRELLAIPVLSEPQGS